jgi:hypothetical protein
MHSIHFIRGSLCCFTARHGSGGEAVVGTPQRLCAAGRALPRRPWHGKLQLSRTTSFSAVSIMLLSCQAGQQLHHTSSSAAGASCAAIAAGHCCCQHHLRLLLLAPDRRLRHTTHSAPPPHITTSLTQQAKHTSPLLTSWVPQHHTAPALCGRQHEKRRCWHLMLISDTS